MASTEMARFQTSAVSAKADAYPPVINRFYLSGPAAHTAEKVDQAAQPKTNTLNINPSKSTLATAAFIFAYPQVKEIAQELKEPIKDLFKEKEIIQPGVFSHISESISNGIAALNPFAESIEIEPSPASKAVEFIANTRLYKATQSLSNFALNCICSVFEAPVKFFSATQVTKIETTYDPIVGLIPIDDDIKLVDVPSPASQLVSSITGGITNNFVVNGISNTISGTVNTVSNIYNSIYSTVITTPKDAVVTFFSESEKKVPHMILNGMLPYGEDVEKIPSPARQMISSAKDEIYNAGANVVNGTIDRAIAAKEGVYNAGAYVANGAINGAIAAKDGVYNAGAYVLNTPFKVGSAVSEFFSPAKTPGYIYGFYEEASPASQMISSAKDGIYNAGASVVNGISNTLATETGLSLFGHSITVGATLATASAVAATGLAIAAIRNRISVKSNKE